MLHYVINGFLLFIIPVALFVLWRIANAPAARSHRPRADRPAPVIWRLPYRKKDSLLSDGEYSLYEALCDAVGGELHVFPKVRLTDLVWLPKGMRAAMHRTVRQHVDFVLCDRQWLSPVLVIELDDGFRRGPEGRAQDAVVAHVLRTAGLPLLHVGPQSPYVAGDLARLINEKIARKPQTDTGNGELEPEHSTESRVSRPGNGSGARP